MVRLSEKEVDILKFIRRSRHKTTAEEIAQNLQLPPSEVYVFVLGMVHQKLLNVVPGTAQFGDAYYTNPERREEIYELIG